MFAAAVDVGSFPLMAHYLQSIGILLQICNCIFLFKHKKYIGKISSMQKYVLQWKYCEHNIKRQYNITLKFKNTNKAVQKISKKINSLMQNFISRIISVAKNSFISSGKKYWSNEESKKTIQSASIAFCSKQSNFDIM